MNFFGVYSYYPFGLAEWMSTLQTKQDQTMSPLPSSSVSFKNICAVQRLLRNLARDVGISAFRTVGCQLWHSGLLTGENACLPIWVTFLQELLQLDEDSQRESLEKHREEMVPSHIDPNIGGAFQAGAPEDDLSSVAEIVDSARCRSERTASYLNTIEAAKRRLAQHGTKCLYCSSCGELMIPRLIAVPTAKKCASCKEEDGHKKKFYVVRN
ncbi:MAG: hypothetical protein KC736_01280 [Candidatus Moranbacteria bacterium]|nr:hypothetical protein [Candidatus Moranbacteria bacterium]